MLSLDGNVESHASVAVVVVRRREPRWLLLERAPAKGGGWQVVTGRVEPGEPGEAAAKREVEEETGLAVVRVVDLGLEAEFTGYDGRRYRERSFLAEVDGEHRLSAEHVKGEWLAYGEAYARLTWEENRRAIARAAAALGGGNFPPPNPPT